MLSCAEFLAEFGDYLDWRDIPSEALEQKELREALTRALGTL
jgi:hypothetical protein